mmetsp:Transcript_52968/g.139260  ORF Transcript_52968/g.139260 Transcript_52968/m.139260 type:complete len:229 (-) Transcript_52968:16-702(-)
MSRLALPLACSFRCSLGGLKLFLGLVYDRGTAHCVARALPVVCVEALPAANVDLARKARPAPVALLPATLRLPHRAAHTAGLSAICRTAEIVLRVTAAVLFLYHLQLLHHHLVLRLQLAHDHRGAVVLLATCLLAVRRFFLTLLLAFSLHVHRGEPLQLSRQRANLRIAVRQCPAGRGNALLRQRGHQPLDRRQAIGRHRSDLCGGRSACTSLARPHAAAATAAPASV